MLEDIERAPEFQSVANLAEVDNRIRLREIIALFERLFNERFERRFPRGIA